MSKRVKNTRTPRPLPLSVPPTVSFRLAPEPVQRLAEAAAAKGMSRHEYAREIVLDRLDQRDRLSARFDELAQEFEIFRGDFANAVEGILLALTEQHKPSKEHIQRWVDLRLRHGDAVPSAASVQPPGEGRAGQGGQGRRDPRDWRARKAERAAWGKSGS